MRSLFRVMLRHAHFLNLLVIKDLAFGLVIHPWTGPISLGNISSGEDHGHTYYVTLIKYKCTKCLVQEIYRAFKIIKPYNLSTNSVVFHRFYIFFVHFHRISVLTVARENYYPYKRIDATLKSH